jgi:hypothetical protein
MWAMSVLGNAKSDRHRKTHEVELDGAGRKYMHLPGEISAMRVVEKSAESVVAKRFVERRAERRDEESRKWGPNRAHGDRREAVESKGRCNCGSHPLRRWNRDEWILIRATELADESKPRREERETQRNE